MGTEVTSGVQGQNMET